MLVAGTGVSALAEVCVTTRSELCQTSSIIEASMLYPANVERSCRLSRKRRECNRNSEACESQMIPEAFGEWNMISNCCAACASLMDPTSTHKTTTRLLLGHGVLLIIPTIAAASGANSHWTTSSSGFSLVHQELNIPIRVSACSGSTCDCKSCRADDTWTVEAIAIMWKRGFGCALRRFWPALCCIFYEEIIFYIHNTRSEALVTLQQPPVSLLCIS